jgi:signal transduction histidine kinase
MIVSRWLQDTIARRFATTIVVAIVIAIGMSRLVIEFAGGLARPPLLDSGLLEQADDIVRMVEAVPIKERPLLAEVAGVPTVHVDWYAADTTIATALGAAADLKTADFRVSVDLPGFRSAGVQRRILYFKANTAEPSVPKLSYDRLDYPDTRFFAVALDDHSWVVFTIPTRLWGLERSSRVAIGLIFLVISVVVVSAVATYQLAHPIKRFTESVHRFGSDPRLLTMPEIGPRELRTAIGAFNAMQSRIQRFVDDRTFMLAAISHDLRTPLTRMRLRAEFVDDEDQRKRLSRDVDDMQVMIDSALAFFRDDSQDEESTMFDFPELLRTIADDYGDQGIDVAYRGPDRAAFRGRPFALKRAFTNLVENAVKYAGSPEIELLCDARSMCVVVSDHGPGIPEDAAERVFTPFYRLERSRNRGTGGVGLGLTSARAVVRNHGGDISLHNRPGGGLEVRVTLLSA